MLEAIKRRMGGIRDRIIPPQWTHEDKVRFLRMHQRMQKGLVYVRAFFSNDPWALLKLFGQRNFTYIRHQQDLSRPVPHDDSVAYVVSGPHRPGPAPKRKVIEGEPLGPEDYELGLKVPPGEPIAELEALWLNVLRHYYEGP